MQVAVIGTGYVGLVSAVCLAELGHQVIALDLDADKVARINRGEPPIHEPGLPELLRRHLGQRLRATTSLREALRDSPVSMIAVGTPFDGARIDLSAVTAASRDLGTALRETSGYHVVTVKSTVVPGTTEKVVLPALESGSGKRAGRDFGVCMNPEFLTEGQAVQDFLHPDRIVLGSIDERSGSVLAELYRGLDAPVIRTNPRTAEMIKYASNAMLATAISFSNEIADLCGRLGGIDVADVMRGVHLSQYLSPALPAGGRIRAPLAAFFEAGCGFGGSCLPKDVKALVAQGSEAGVSLRILAAVLEVNAGRTDALLALLRRHFRNLAGTRVTVLGLAFKPDTDDIRESPGIRVVERLVAEGARVTAYDPAARPSLNGPGSAGDRVKLAPSLKAAVAEAEAVVITTRWDEFRGLAELLQGREPPPVVVDGRRILEPGSVARYEGIGRSPSR